MCFGKRYRATTRIGKRKRFLFNQESFFVQKKKRTCLSTSPSPIKYLNEYVMGFLHAVYPISFKKNTPFAEKACLLAHLARIWRNVDILEGFLSLSLTQ
jgi:hypothetical protein